MPTRPHLQYKVALAIALVLLTTRISLNRLHYVGFNILAGASDITVDNVVKAVNNERAKRNIPTLNYNTKLAAAADYKSRDMIARKYFSHTDPDGKYIWDKIVAEGYTPYTVLGENLAIDFSDTEGLVSAWIDSPTHRANLLNTNFKDQGMGVALGDVNSGEYSVAITNTFGAQPANAAPAPAPAPAPTQTAIKPTTTSPKPVVKPAPAAAAEPAPTITLTINTSDEVTHRDSVTIVGHTAPKLALTLKDLNAPDQQPINITSDGNGNFVYTYKTLNNGIHNFVATSGNTTSNSYKIQVLYNPPQIDRQTVNIEPQISGKQLNLEIAAKVSGDPQTVSAAVAGKSTALVLGASQTYVGTLSLDQYSNYQDANLIITAADQYGNKNNLTVPLSDYPLSEKQNPKGPGNLANKAQSPDLYTVFKYVVLIFGALFIFFVFGDTLHLTKRGWLQDDFTKGSNIIIILLILSTLLLVNWWH